MNSVDSRFSERECGVEQACLNEENRPYHECLAGDKVAISADLIFAELRAKNN